MRNQISNPSMPSKWIMQQLLLFFLVLILYTIDPNLPETDEYIINLVKRAKEGDDGAFTSLFELYRPAIQRHLYRMVGHEEDARDLTEDTFIRAWYRLPRIRDAKRFRGWLYKIATNAALDHVRSKNSQKRGSQPPQSLHKDYSNEQTTGFEERVEEQELIKLSLEEIAPKPRACFLLYHEGFSQKEIAELMGLKIKSVGTYLSTAREQFRKAYHRLKEM